MKNKNADSGHNNDRRSDIDIYANSGNQGLQSYTSQSHDSFDDDEDIDLGSLWRMVRRYQKLILISFISTLIISLLMTIMMRPVYTAKASLELNIGNRSLVKFNKLQSENVNQGRYIQSQIAILRSRAIANEVVQKLNLVQEPEFNGGVSQRSISSVLKSIFVSRDVTNTSGSIGLAEAIYLSRLTVSPLPRSNIMKVTVRSFDPELAAKIANAHIAAYISLTSSRRFDSSSEAKKFIEKELSSVKTRLKLSETSLTDFARKNNDVDIDIEDTDNSILARLSVLNKSLSEVQGERINAETNYIQAKTSNSLAVGAIAIDPIVVNLKQQRAELQARYFELSKLYKPKYPAMQELQAKLDEINTGIEEQASAVVGGLKSYYEQLTAREKGLQKAVQSLKNELFVLRDRAVEYNILKREWEADKSLYSELLERSKELGVASGIELNAGSLIEAASAPKKSSSPNFKFNLSAAAVLGLGLGLGLALFLSLLDTRIHSVRELEQLLNLPNISVLPAIEEEASQTLPDLQALSAPGDIFSESINSLRSSLKYFRGDKGVPLGSLAVTSATAGEGKSLISINLAISYANSGLKTLLIEADLRRPRIAKVFDATKQDGLVQSLDLGGSVKAKKFSDIPNLNVIFAGSVSNNPIEHLSSSSMAALVAKCESEYDAVIIDCPPVLGLADTIEISSLVDGVLLVVSAHQVSKNSVEHATDRLRMVRAPVVGTIFNRADPEMSGYDYYAYGYYTDKAGKAVV